MAAEDPHAALGNLAVLDPQLVVGVFDCLAPEELLAPCATCKRMRELALQSAGKAARLDALDQQIERLQSDLRAADESLERLRESAFANLDNLSVAGIAKLRGLSEPNARQRKVVQALYILLRRSTAVDGLAWDQTRQCLGELIELGEAFDLNRVSLEQAQAVESLLASAEAPAGEPSLASEACEQVAGFLRAVAAYSRGRQAPEYLGPWRAKLRLGRIKLTLEMNAATVAGGPGEASEGEEEADLEAARESASESDSQ
eukprot:tig00000865_g5072.t1